VLSFVGVKMLLAHTPYKIDTLVSLGIIAVILAASVIASLMKPKHPVKFTDPSGIQVLADPEAPKGK
jgi:predicted tellurium resistance membrane protein TerC